MAIVTPALLTSLMTGFRREFQQTLTETPTAYERIATTVPSSSKSNTYGWLGQMPGFREWVGDRVLKDMAAHSYSINNKLFEMTVSVKRTDIEDDSVGVYGPMMSEMGRATKAHPDELVFSLLKTGSASLCYDGQNFFDADHPIFPNNDGTGTAETVSNFTDGTGPAWYLLDASRALKPVIFQQRTRPEFTAMTKSEDENVFMRDEYRYGVRARHNVGFGFWQLAHMSKKPLNGVNFSTVVAAMQELKADGGRPLGVKPTLLVVPPTLRTAALEVVKAERNAQGATNINKGAVEDVLVTPWVS